MSTIDPPNITSFVIRFVQETPDETRSPYRGNIRHVQSNADLNFTDWAEAVAFIQRYVPLQMAAVQDQSTHAP
ncbi:MAG TPA: hypothetical protein VI451_12220 [Anaerolineales bacterium]|jgi:hypothetical protein|nr:hypothetical protein [Anaerolineales bacterium]